MNAAKKSNVFHLPNTGHGRETQIDLTSSQVLKYIVQRGMFSKEYGSQMKEGQERYLLEGLCALMNGSEEYEITIFQKFFNDKERISISEPFHFLNLMGHSGPSVVAFEVYKHFGFKVYIGYDNGLDCFDDKLSFYKRVNTSAIGKNERVNHFVNTLSCDPDWMHESDTKKDDNKVYCPECDNEMVLRNGKYGSFYGCSKYPSCKCTRKNKKTVTRDVWWSEENEHFDDSHFDGMEGNPNDFGDR